MKMTSTGVVLGLMVSWVLCGVAAAEKPDELTVTGSRFLATPVGINYTGVPIKDVSLSYGVSLADIDLESAAGQAEMDRRVVAAARAACHELARLYPVSQPDTARCTKTAADRSIARMHKMMTGAHAAPGT